MITFSLGEPFPFPRLITDTDSIKPALRENGFDIILSLDNMTEAEMYDILDGPFMVYYHEYKCATSVSLEFPDGSVWDFAIDIRRSGLDPQTWADSFDPQVRLFLLDTVTGILRGMRIFELPKPEKFASLMRRQSLFSQTEVEEAINEQQILFDPHYMIETAKYSDLVRPSTRL